MRTLIIWWASCLSLVAGERRIASYSPGATQTLLDLGCGGEIVMATRWCPLPEDHPAERSADIFLPDLERLLLAKPDLVVIPRMANPLWAEKCAGAGLRTLVLHRESADSVSQDIRLLGEATGRSDQALRLSGELTKRPGGEPRLILVVWDGVMAGPDSYLAEPMAAAGWKSALPQGAWLKFDWELLAGTKPEAVLWIQNGPKDGPIGLYPEKVAEMKGLPSIRSLPCVVKEQVYLTSNRGKWLPGSGLNKIADDLRRLRDRVGP
jgi:ABC-type Fe3+-hydroxamate transport system substrate-binding protein